MAIEELLRVAMPPFQPLEVGSLDDWRVREQSLGITFPRDLYDYCLRYGSGQFGTIQIYNPWSAEYIQFVESTLDMFRIVKQDRGPLMPYSVFPEVPGLFPAGGTQDSGKLFWLADGPPETWPLVLSDSTTEWQRLDLELTSFLAKTLRACLDTNPTLCGT